MPTEHVHFVTGRLAEPSLRGVASKLAESVGFQHTIDVLPITVAALMTSRWIARHIRVPETATRVLLPGYCTGELHELEAMAGVLVERGPKDLRQLPEFFGQSDPDREDFGKFDIRILAEINHAPRLTRQEILAQAERYRLAGADVIDVGCEPGDPWTGVGDCVAALREAGHRVSIDSFEPREVEAAVRRGAELVLSVNRSNRQAAVDWGCEVVVIPDDLKSLDGLDETVEFLSARNVPTRLDPVLEPIGCGFAASLGRYLEIRRRYPAAEMLMGVGNLSELTDADSAGVNVLLLGICQELEIRSVLTTEVINWARTSVRECDLARRLVHFAVRHSRPPKRVDSGLVMLRDPQLFEFSSEELEKLMQQIKDRNYRLFVSGGQLHLLSAALHLAHRDPFALFGELMARGPGNVDADHAFYLGYELAKASIAMLLGKQYEQDEALQWGHLTVPEEHHGSKSASFE